MKKEINTAEFSKVIAALIDGNCKTATRYLDDKTVVRATWRNKPSNQNKREEIVVTYGCPNYLEVKFIKDCKTAGVSFPVKRIQLKFYPKKKGVTK